VPGKFIPVVDVFITIFGDFANFLGEKLAFFLKAYVMNQYWHNLLVFLSKTPIFCRKL
jgi:hypothetical protein